jgi:hypothetical protein
MDPVASGSSKFRWRRILFFGVDLLVIREAPARGERLFVPAQFRTTKEFSGFQMFLRFYRYL